MSVDAIVEMEKEIEGLRQKLATLQQRKRELAFAQREEIARAWLEKNKAKIIKAFNTTKEKVAAGEFRVEVTLRLDPKVFAEERELCVVAEVHTGNKAQKALIEYHAEDICKDGIRALFPVAYRAAESWSTQFERYVGDLRSECEIGDLEAEELLKEILSDS